MTILLERAPAGVARPVLQAPHRMLVTPCTSVDAMDAASLVADLTATMRAVPGCVGLAAPQIGRAAHVVVIDVNGLLALCNTRVVDAAHWRPCREGCVSVPGLAGEVMRAGRLVVTGERPGSGERVELTLDGFEAQVLQHQLDHCAGLLFLDRVRGARAVRPIRRTAGR
jgi:peptide deformylase